MSNHGGNNLDSTPATIRALPPIVEAVGGDIEVVIDGGIRRGSDVVKAVALGARAAMIGRAYLWGLAANGQAGVENVLDILRSGIDSALLALGRGSVSELAPTDVLVPSGFVRRLGDASAPASDSQRVVVNGRSPSPRGPDRPPRRLRWPRSSWPEVAGVADGVILVVPVGSTEQHGPHLPLGTDSDVAVALAERLASARADVLVAPAAALRLGRRARRLPGHAVDRRRRSGAGRGGAGAVGVDAFAGVVLVSGHGGNAAPLAAAVATLRAEGRAVLAWSPRIPGGDAHAGRTETSMLLALAPDSVRLDAAEPGDTRPLAAVIGELRRRGVAAVSPNGVLGDPAAASADEGRRILDDLAVDLVAAVEAWRP